MKVSLFLALLTATAAQYNDYEGRGYNEDQQQGGYYQENAYRGDTLYQDYADGQQGRQDGGGGGYACIHIIL